MKLSSLKIMGLAALLLSFFAFVCGNDKTETTDVKKQDNTTQTQTNQTQTQTQQQTKTDSMTTKTDTTDSKDKKDSKTSNIVVMKTSMGDIEIELFEKDAPQHVANFKKLVNSGFYEGTTFHRVIQGFMIQGGDPNSKDSDRSNDGQGGPGYTVPAEIKAKHEIGALAGARLGDAVNPKKESSGSQFYIVTGDASHLDGQYTVYGKVTKGMDIAYKIEKVKKDGMDNPIDKITIQKISYK